MSQCNLFAIGYALNQLTHGIDPVAVRNDGIEVVGRR